MNTNAIRDVATRARRQLMEAVERRCLLYGIDEGAQRDAEIVNGRVLSAAERAQRRELMRIQDDLRGDGKPGTGHAALVEQAAYTWFNRLFAIRFMELNDRLPSHVRMLSAQDGSFAPECLREAMDLPLDALDREGVARLVAEGDDEGLFRLLLLAQCAELAECMPAVFERVGSAMELLLPDSLLTRGGIVESLVTGIPEGDWREGVEIVGWAYQFYVSERKAEYLRSKRKAGKDDIAPATQLFTPEYIVRFLVQNSLGRFWVLNNLDNQSSHLAGEMEYFVKPDPEDHEAFRRITSPEDITLIDPACGSGHFLCYAFDLLARMYEERGYRRRDIAKLILEKNLTGIEIDRRAASLTSFALTMKACELDSRFLRRSVTPRVVCIEPIELSSEERGTIGASSEHQSVVDLLAHLGEVGSLWQPTVEEISVINEWYERADKDQGLFGSTAKEKLARAKGYIHELNSIRDVCSTNPPYMGTGSLAPWMSDWVKKNYPNEKADLCTCFITRGFSFVNANGYNSQVTMQSWMFLDGFRNMRRNLSESKSIVCLAHLGARAFDAIGGEVVQTSATVFGNSGSDIEGVYLRLVDGKDEKSKTAMIRDIMVGGNESKAYRKHLSDFRAITGWPIAYWASKQLIDLFSNNEPLSTQGRYLNGMSTGKNEAVVRQWYEVSFGRISIHSSSEKAFADTGARYAPYNKGGDYRKWYGNQWFVLAYDEQANALMDTFVGHRHNNPDTYFHECLSWSKVSSGKLAMRFFPDGFVYDVAGCSLFLDDPSLLRYILGLFNSSFLMKCLEFLSPTLNFEAGQIRKAPYVEADGETKLAIDCLVDDCINLARTDWDSFETSWDFLKHPLVRGNRIASAYGLWSTECKDRFDALKANEERLNALFARVYHMEGEVPIPVEADKVSVRLANLEQDVRSLISYAVGCMFGRYSLDKPGLMLANQGDGLSEYLAQVPHPRYMPDGDGILPITDDEYFEDDIVAMFCEFLKVAYGPETLEENLQFVADGLGGTGSARKVIRNYFMNQFFIDHCATYSVPNAGKRPVYWLIDSGKLGGFRALIYMHRYTPDLLARVRTDYVHERQERYRSRIAELEREREGASRREQSAIDKELKRLRAQLDEVTSFEERLHHLADQMIEVDLDDGFMVNYAKFADVMAKVK